MANTATALTKIAVQARAGLHDGLITPVVVAFDTTGADLTVFTPGANRMAAVLGMKYAEASAHSLIWTSGSTVLLTEERAANAVVNERIGRPIIVSQPGEALKLQCATAVIGSMLLYIGELKYIELLSL